MGDMSRYDDDITRLSRLETIVLPMLEYELRTAATLDEVDHRAALRHIWAMVDRELKRVVA